MIKVYYEGRDADLYHNTDLGSLESIIRTNRLGLYPEEVKSVTAKKLQMVYGDDFNPSYGGSVIDYVNPNPEANKVSLSRSKNHKFNQSGVTIVIDQRTLTYNYKITPKGNPGGDFDEMEEIVNKPITNVGRYIKRIIISSEDWMIKEQDEEIMRTDPELFQYGSGMNDKEFEDFLSDYISCDDIKKFCDKNSIKLIIKD